MSLKFHLDIRNLTKSYIHYFHITTRLKGFIPPDSLSAYFIPITDKKLNFILETHLYNQFKILVSACIIIFTHN
jgi:hypothetical protein